MATILIIDDEPAIRAVMSDWLIRSGHTVRHTSLMREAKYWLQLPNKVDLVVTDLIRPRSDGLQLLKMARECGFSGPVLLFTGVTDYENNPAPFDGVLIKPTDPDEFVRWVESFLV